MDIKVELTDAEFETLSCAAALEDCSVEEFALRALRDYLDIPRQSG